MQIFQHPLHLASVTTPGMSCDDFVQDLSPYSAAEIAALEEATCSQSESSLWMMHPRGRITGTSSHTVVAKYRKFLKGKSFEVSSMIDMVMGYKETSSPNLPNFVYGRKMELRAKEAYHAAQSPHQVSLRINS